MKQFLLQCRKSSPAHDDNACNMPYNSPMQHEQVDITALKDTRLVRSILIIMALMLCAWFIYSIHTVLLLAFAAVLVALIFTSIADYIVKNSRLPHGWALGIAILCFITIIGLAGFMFGSQVNTQLRELSTQLPEAWAHLVRSVGDPDLETNLQAEITKLIPDGGSILSLFRGILSSLGGVLSGLVLALVGGIYLAAQPQVYFKGALMLFPHGMRERIKDASLRTATSLRAWLAGQLLAMVAVGIVTGMGLWMIGVPSPIALGLIAAVLEFIPMVGPILMAIPAILLAMTIDLETTLMTAGLYLAIQQTEGHVLLPYIQQKSVDLPPALTLFALFALGGIFGVVGVLLAAPMTVVMYVMVKTLYIRNTLGEDIDLPERT